MTERDAAFLWETEALRGSRRRGEVSDTVAARRPAGVWATLREAYYQTGIPIETLRKWARRGAVASFLDESEIGVRRMVRMDAVRRRARDLGRPIAPVPRPSQIPAAPPPAPQEAFEEPGAVPAPAAADDREGASAETMEPGASPEEEPEVPAEMETGPSPDEDTGPSPDEDTGPSADEETGPSPEEDTGPSAEKEAGAQPEEEESLPQPSPPDGTMIVPIAAWDKMLMQLGNLHEAGQQLAEARERAARAETEATFLRERLGEMRRELQDTKRDASRVEAPAQPVAEVEHQAGADAPEPEPSREPQREKLWRYIYRGWRNRRR